MTHRGGNVYASETGYVLEALGAVRFARAAGGELVAAASGGLDVFAEGDSCLIDSSGQCRSRSSLSRASLLVGWQTGNRPTFRALGGMAYYVEDTGNAVAAGIEGRFDVGIPLDSHFGIALSMRAARLPNVRDRSVNVFAATLGVRLH